MKENCLSVLFVISLVFVFSCTAPLVNKDDSQVAMPDAMTGATKVAVGKNTAVTMDQAKQKVRDLLAMKRFLSLATIDALEHPVLGLA